MSCAAGFAREEISLNGEWEYQKAADLTYPPSGAWNGTTVPGYLGGYNYERAWFRKSFVLPDSMSGMRIKLAFGGVKYDSRVYVNGRFVGGYLNGYDPFELDITKGVRFGEGNELLVGLSDWTALFSDRVDFSNLQPGENPRERARNVILAPIGGRYDLYGIWQGVTLHSVPDFSIEDVFVMTSVRKSRITVRVRLRNYGAEEKSGNLKNKVLDGEETALALPEVNVSVGAGEAREVDVEAEWPGARLWTLADPHLYHLETNLQPSNGPADMLLTRFGFREFWCEGESFCLNGTKIHLLATSCWPCDSLTGREAIRNVLLDVKAGNNVAFRLHTQPWDETWYDVADEVGLLIVEEGAVWCDTYGYRLADATFWSNFADHLKGAVRRDRNHPSIVMWSLENELLQCGAGTVYPGTEGELANLGRMVKELDPTRPITYEADLDPGGVADVIGLHYPHEFPEYHLWPDTACWLDEPIKLAHSPGGTWQWNRQKPLYIGEFLWVPAPSPDGFSILYGDEVYSDRDFYRNWAKGWTWRMQIEAYRDSGVSGMCPWTMFEDIATRWGVLDLNPEENRLYQAQKAAYHPNAVFVKEYDSRFFVGETVERSLSVYNDTMFPGDFVLNWSAAGYAESRTFWLQPGERREERIALRVPSVPGDFAFKVELLKGGARLFSDEKSYSAHAQPTLSLPEATRLGVYDTDGAASGLLAKHDIGYLPVVNLQTAPYDQFDMLVVGRDSLKEEQSLEVGAESIAAKWEAFCERGGWVVVLEQPSYPRWMALGLSPSNHASNFAFPGSPGHSIASGLSSEDLRWWRGDNRVTAGNLPKPSRGNFRVLVDVGSKNGLDHVALIEIPRGRGGYVCSQMLLASKFASEPMAGILLERILNYCSASTRLRHAGIVAEADSEAAKTLSRLGLLYENLHGRLAARDLAAYPILVIAGGEAAWSEAAACLQKLLSYVGNGGKLLLHRPSESFLAAAGAVLIPELEAAPNAAVPILRNAPDDGALGLTNYDLYWIEQAGSWDRPATLSRNIAERVYRKRFSLTSYNVIEVENMPVKTGGAPVSGGWNMYVNGYVAQEITVPKSARYLFGVVARGTAVFGEYPQMVLRIDGKSQDSVIVDSETWHLYSLAAEFSAGEHELALAFTNDAWNPPEDRNLYMDKVRYGPDPSPESELFITKPGAIVRMNRGNGFLLLDEIAWEKEQKNRAKAERIISCILTDLGAVIRTPSGLRVEAEEMNPVGFGYFRIYDGIAWCGSNGRLEAPITFTSSGNYSFEVTAYGTPALGVYPELELRIDGGRCASLFVDTESPSQFLFTPNVTAGEHTVALAFVNDYYNPPEDRNLALDRLAISQVRETRPRILDLIVSRQTGMATLIWEGRSGGGYKIQLSNGFPGDAWRTAGNVVGAGNVMSWVDDGTSTGLPPGDALVRQRFYRVEAVDGP